MGNQIAAEGADEQDMEVSEISQHKLINNLKVNLPKIENPLNMKEDNSISGGNVLNVGGSCMKEKIDNLIEGYLLNADFNSNSESEDISMKLGGKAKPSKQCSENGNLNSDVEKKTENYSKQDEMEENILGEIQKKRNSEPSDSSSTPSEVCVKVEGNTEETSTKNDMLENLNVGEKSEVKKEAMQDQEGSEKLNNLDPSVRDQKKKMTTFQCLIDEVLDSSVGNKFCSPSNQTPILELCDKMVSSSESENKSQILELNNKMDSSSASDREATASAGNKTNESMEASEKQKFCANDDMSLSKKKVMYLKDHIEKVLERSFPGNLGKKHSTEHPDGKNESTEHLLSGVQDPKTVSNINSSESKNTGNKLNVFNSNIGEGHISGGNSFSTQNIVNNTMDQSKVINNLLSPASKSAAKESAPSNKLLQKSSVGTIMDSIIKNAVNETFGDGKDNGTHTKEDLRHGAHDIIRKCSSPSPPRLEKYDSRDLPHPPRLIQPDEFFTNTHEQLLKQQQQVSQKKLAANCLNPHMSKKSPNPSTATLKETSLYQGHISQGIGKVQSDVSSGSTSSYKFQQNFVQSPKRFQQHSPSGPSTAASFKTSGVSDFHPQAHHLHTEYSPQHQGNHQISLRDCRCVACEKNTDQQTGSNSQHGPLSSKHFEQITKSGISTHYPIQETMQNTLRGSRQSPYQIPNQGRANRSNKSMEELPVNPSVSSAMALGPSPPLRYYQHNSPFRMPQLYPSNPPIPSPREYSRSNSTVNNPHGVNVHVPVPVHPQKGPDVRSPVISSTSTSMNAISPKLLRAPFHGNHPASAQTFRIDVSNSHAQHRQKQENEQNYQHPSMPHINKGMDISPPPVLDLTMKKQSDTNSSPKQSGDQPLDLTCKRPKYNEMSVKNYNVECTPGTSYPISQDTRSNYPILQESRHHIMAKSMHINNLKHSVDKYCNEAKYPHPQKHDVAPRLPNRPTSKEEYQFKSPVHHSDMYSSMVGGTGQRHPVQLYVGQGQSYHNMMSQSNVEPISSQDKISRPLPQSSQGHQQLSPYQQTTHQQASPQQIARPAVSPQQIARPAVSPQQIARPAVSPQQIARPVVSPQQAMFPQQAIGSQQRPVQSSNRQGSPELSVDPNHSRQSSRRSANVSKHEPIQNIIGNHSPNDILYLICRLCGQTYGSPYGFRKHFRNQHGFEPRAEHTIVQTISATKALRDPPVGPPYNVKATTQLHQSSTQSATHYSENQKPYIQGAPVQTLQQQVNLLPLKPALPNAHIHSTEPVAKEDNLQESPVTGGSKSKEKTDVQNTLHVSSFVVMDSKLGESPEEKDAKPTQEDKESKTVESPGERKYLECHECGQTFQLNDFGSYKRHCRQHVHPRMTDPFNPVSENPNYQSQNLNSSRSHVNYQQGMTGHKYSSQNSLPSSQESSSCTANLDSFSCKLCQVNFISESSLKEHIYSVHSNKEKFTCLICDMGFSIYRDYQRHMSVSHHLDMPSSDAFRCPETIAAEQIDLDVKALAIEKTEEKKTSDDPNMSLINKFRVIPSCHVTRMSADTAVTTASPDSSSDPVTSSANQVDSCISSTSLKSNNSTSSITSDFCAELNKSDSLDSTGSPGMSKLSVSRQVSCDSGSTSENVEEFNETKYLHKKFGSKRKNSVNLTVENSANKYGKYGDGRKSPGNNSKSPGSVNSPSANSCASFESESSNLQEINQSTDTGSKKDVKSDAVDGIDDKRIVLKIKCGSNGSSNDSNSSSGVNKGEARHQLPFVWDRVTRSQTGRPVKPPKYH